MEQTPAKCLGSQVRCVKDRDGEIETKSGRFASSCALSGTSGRMSFPRDQLKRYNIEVSCDSIWCRTRRSDAGSTSKPSTRHVSAFTFA